MLLTKNIDAKEIIKLFPLYEKLEILPKYPNNLYITIGYEDTDALLSYCVEDLEIIPFLQYYYTFELVNHLIKSNKISDIFSYGSLGSRKFNKNSDVDLYLISEHSSHEIMQEIKKITEGVYFEGNSIKIWHKDILIECSCTNSIKDSQRYVSHSPYVAGGKRIFHAKNVNLLAQNLEEFAKIEPDVEQLIKDNKIRLYHNTRKLEKYKDDIYRFKFHTEIIEHCVVRLRAIKNDDATHNYTPRNAFNYLSKEEWQILQFTVSDNVDEYIKSIRLFVEQVLEEI